MLTETDLPTDPRAAIRALTYADEASLVRIVAGDQRFTRAEARAGFERRTILVDARVGPETKDLDVDDPHAVIMQAARSRAHHLRIADHRPLRLFRRCRQKAQTDVPVTCLGRACDLLRRRKLEHRQRRERDRPVSCIHRTNALLVQRSRTIMRRPWHVRRGTSDSDRDRSAVPTAADRARGDPFRARVPGPRT